MNRRVDDRNILEKFAQDFCDVIDKYCKYIVVSGFVAIASGRTRATEDIDMIIEKISKETFEKLHTELMNKGFECVQSSNPDDIYEYLEKGDGIRYVWAGRNYFPPEMEIHFVKDEIDELQLATRQKLEFVDVDIWFSSIDMNIAFKEELLKDDKDIKDAKHLRLIYKDKISEENINNIKAMIIRLRLKENER